MQAMEDVVGIPKMITAGLHEGTDLQFIIMQKLGYSLAHLMMKNS